MSPRPLVAPAAALALALLSLPARCAAVQGEVAVPIPARRIVSLAPSVTETLFALGADSLIVGVSRHCDVPVAAKLKPKVGEFNTPDLAKVLAAAPDVVLFAEHARPEDIEALSRAGVPSLVLPARSVSEVVATITKLGEIAGRAGEARRLTEGIEAAVREIAGRLAAIPARTPPSVYVEVDGPEVLYAVGPGSFMDDIIRLAGGRNVFAGRQAAYFPVAGADVIAADPEVILVDYPFQYKVGLAKRPGWDAVAAVRGGRVFDGTDYDIILFNRPGPRIAQALREIARLLHPQVFREP
ncbi:MAG TPA: ABC transporter substrate-binding protein [Candidatus Methanoperedens sp.]|nr:ABC transporter substrate-binding protein [Candidatus Methanoperedens sp.]